MAISRYRRTETIKNTDNDYKRVFASRFGKNGLVQLKSTKIKKPSQNEIDELTYSTETWGLGKRLYKMAYQYYGDVQYWWLIALFNGIGSESEINYGDKIKIPSSLEDLLTLYGF